VLPVWRSADCRTCSIAVRRPLPRVRPQLDSSTWIACASGGWPTAHPGLAARCAHLAACASAVEAEAEAEGEDVGETVALGEGDADRVTPGAGRRSCAG
jgi:hypothetical protein